jgi:hypothetical protein
MNAFGSSASSGDAASKHPLLRRRPFAILALLLGLSLVLGTTVFREQVARAAPAILQVFVVNDTRHPVPVHEQGIADVNVTNTPLAVRESGETPIQRELQFDFDLAEKASDTYTVPADKRLRIELVTYDQTDPSRLSKFLVTTTVDNQEVTHSLKSTRHDPFMGLMKDMVTEPVRICADPGTIVEFTVLLSDLTTKSCPGVFMGCNGSFSGVLIDVP